MVYQMIWLIFYGKLVGKGYQSHGSYGLVKVGWLYQRLAPGDTPWKNKFWIIIPWRFGSDHFPWKKMLISRFHVNLPGDRVQANPLKKSGHRGWFRNPIPNHLGCIKPLKYKHYLPYQLVQDFFINSIYGCIEKKHNFSDWWVYLHFRKELISPSANTTRLSLRLDWLKH